LDFYVMYRWSLLPQFLDDFSIADSRGSVGHVFTGISLSANNNLTNVKCDGDAFLCFFFTILTLIMFYEGLFRLLLVLFDDWGLHWSFTSKIKGVRLGGLPNFNSRSIPPFDRNFRPASFLTWISDSEFGGGGVHDWMTCFFYQCKWKPWDYERRKMGVWYKGIRSF